MPDDPPGLLELLSTGLAHHRAGRYKAAEDLYTRALAGDPTNATALYLYGSLDLAIGRIEDAESRLARAVALRPKHRATLFAYANALCRRGAWGEAARYFRAILREEPDHLGARVNLSSCLREEGDAAAALIEAEVALGQAPASPEALTTTAAARSALGEEDAAMAAYRAAIAANPRHLPAYIGLAGSLLRAGRPGEALTYGDAALLLSPNLPEGQFLCGLAMARLGAKAAAIASVRAAIVGDPDHAKAHLALANLLVDEGEESEAECLYRRAIALDPRLTEAYVSLTSFLTAAGRLSEAISSCAAALAIDPTCVQAHWNEGIALLLAGDYERGWEEYEVRKERWPSPGSSRTPGGLQWRGEDLSGRTILVLAEQGLGDTIQFARYLPLLAARGASVVLACDPSLIPLLTGQVGAASVVARGSEYPACDFWVSEMSLPRRFQTRLDSIPFASGYLHADPTRVARWNEKLPAGIRIGLVWAGNPRHSNDTRRSIRLAGLAPLLETPRVSFVSLQVGGAEAEAGGFPFLLNFSSELTDFAETAALIEALDLVISVDTSSAHCAAAMGKETWVMLPHAPDWRWLLARTDSPWYGAVRLFRQARPGAWPGAVSRVRRSLSRWLGQKRGERAAGRLAPG